MEYTSQFHEDFIKNNNKESDEGYFHEADVQYLEKLHQLPNNLPFLLKSIKIEKAGKLVANLHDKTECYTHKKFKIGIRSCVGLKKVHRMIKFNQNAWLKP